MTVNIVSTPRADARIGEVKNADPFAVDDLKATVASIIDGSNDGILNENANKDRNSIPTRRDLIAGAAVKDYALSRMDPRFAEAHRKGIIHIHDLDYFSGDQINCSIPDVAGMFREGTVISDKSITTPKSLQTAATLLSQIIAQVASNQYGGTTINNVNELLAPYLRVSHDKYKKLLSPVIGDDEEKLEEAAKVLSDKELSSAIQTISYQISTLSTSNGQTPFVTMSLRTDPEFEYKDESNRIIAEILDQRTKGIPGVSGRYETQVFPKLIFVTNEYNVPKDSEFHWLLRKAAKCTASRMYPDYVSEKIMRRDYGNVFAPMGCRSFLPPYYDESGTYRVEGRFNKGVCTVNVPRCAIEARISVLGDAALDPSVLPWAAAHGKDGAVFTTPTNVRLASGETVSASEAYRRIEEAFWTELDAALDILRGVQLYRVECLKGTKASSAPMLWMHGALARLRADDVIDPLFYGGYSSLSLGYIGLYEASMLAAGTSNFSKEGDEFSLEIIKHLENRAKEWDEDDNVGWSVYGTPSESLVGRFAKLIRSEFGQVNGLVDDSKNYLTNSFHVCVTQPTDAFSKIAFESKFQPHSKGGTISYVEMGDLRKNVDAVLSVIEFAYNHILYSEFNGRNENICLACGHEGELTVSEKDGHWGYECPECGNRDNDKIIAVARICGYLGDNRHGISEFKLQEFGQRVMHI